MPGTVPGTQVHQEMLAIARYRHPRQVIGTAYTLSLYLVVSIGETQVQLTLEPLGFGVLTPRAVRNPHITFDSLRT